MQLSSAKNPLLQGIRRAAKAGRSTEDGCVVAEGPHLLDEALRSSWKIEQVFATAAARNRHQRLLERIDSEIVEVSERAFQTITETQTSQGILATLRPRTWSWEQATAGQSLLIVLDGLQDPGNAGAIARSAEAFGATGIVLLEGCVRVSNAKLMRASAGSIFRIPFLEGVLRETLLQRLHDSRIGLYALSVAASMPLWDARLTSPLALAIGAEGQGISAEIASAARVISIPTVTVESLNAAAACSVALFETARQRRKT